MNRLLPFVFIAASSCSSQQPPPQPPLAPQVLEPVSVPSVGLLVETRGKVELERQGRVAKAEAGPVFEGDVVSTGPASGAVLRDGLGREVELGEDTHFRVGSRLSAIEVVAGDISFASSDGGSGWSDVSVKTPFGVATLRDGALGRLTFVDGGVAATVSFGTIEFEVYDGGVKTAKAGESFAVSFGTVEFDQTSRGSAAVTLVVEAGKPQVRRAGEKRFSAAKSREVLPAGSAFQTNGSASARLESAHAVVALGRDSRGNVEAVREENGKTTLVLSQTAGPLSVQFDGTAPAALDLGDVMVAGANESSIAVTQNGKQRRVEVRAGRAEVTVKGKATWLQAGEAVTVDGKKATPATVGRPTIIAQAGQKIRVHVDSVKVLGIALPLDENRVEVSRDADFSTTILKGRVGKTLLVPVLARSPLFFRVLSEQGAATQQGRIEFLPDLGSARDTATRTESVSETGQKATVFYQSKVPALTFHFNPQPTTTSWRFRMYRAQALDRAVVDRKVPESKLVLEPGVLEEGEFLWSATPLDPSGNEAQGARMNKLSVVYDNARTSLLIERPVDGERAGRDTRAVGVAPRSAQIYINGKPVKPDDSGRFSVLLGSVETAVFRVVAADSESFWVRRLAR